MTAQDLKTFEIIDEIVPEPLGGAHRDHEQAFDNLRAVLKKQLQELIAQDYEKLKKDRTEKFMKIGAKFIEKDQPAKKK